DVKAAGDPAGSTVDFTDLHAWCEVYLPGAGWIGLDATSGLLAGEGHIPLACTPSPSSAAPIEGGVAETQVTFSHEMRLTRIHESPRVTQPYGAAQWAALQAVGQRVDARLAHNQVLLATGGAASFVTADASASLDAAVQRLRDSGAAGTLQ